MRKFLFCSDPRDEANLWDKINQKLVDPAETVTKICFFGAPIFLAHPKELYKGHCFLLDQLHFGVKGLGLDEIILVGHRCGFRSHVPLPSGEEIERADLIKGAELIEKTFHGDVRVSAYYDTSSFAEISFDLVYGEALISNCER